MTDLLGERHAALLALSCLDLTNLEDDCDEAAIRELAARATTRHGTVAALCVWPRFARLARDLAPADVKIATVIVFPSGEATDEEAMDEAHAALAEGADEIDMVIPYRDLMEGRGAAITARVERVKRVAGTASVKAILETGVLASAGMVQEASRLAIEGGADFLKTSTGKAPVNATLSSAEIMLGEIAAASRPLGFKAAGGIRTTTDAWNYLDLAERIMGPDWASPSTFRFGASGLLNALLTTLDGEQALLDLEAELAADEDGEGNADGAKTEKPESY